MSASCIQNVSFLWFLVMIFFFSNASLTVQSQTVLAQQATWPVAYASLFSVTANDFWETKYINIWEIQNMSAGWQKFKTVGIDIQISTTLL